MTNHKIYSVFTVAFLFILVLVVLSSLTLVSAQAETTIFTDLDSFLTASGPLTEIDFENLPNSASSDPNDLINRNYIPNPLVLQGVTITDPVLLRTDFCAPAVCLPDPDNRIGGNILTLINQGATLRMPVGTGGALLIIEGMANTTFTLRVTDFAGNTTDTNSQTTLNSPTYLGFTSINGIRQIELVSLDAPDTTLALSAIYAELFDPDMTIGVWADPIGDVETPNGDLAWGSATVQDEIVDLRVQFLDHPFLTSEAHNITWCFNSDDNAATGSACGYNGADTTFTLSGGTDSLFGGPLTFDGALSALDPCSVGWYDWDSKTIRLMIPLSFLSNTNNVAFVLEGSFQQKNASNNFQTYSDLVPDSPDFSVESNFFSSVESSFAPFGGVPLCSPYQEMEVSIEATGTIEFFPEFGLLRNAPVGTWVQSNYFKTTDENRRFRRGFIELAIPELPNGVEVSEATLILPENRARVSGERPPTSHTVSYYYGADLSVNPADYNRVTTLVHQTFASHETLPPETFSLDVTDAINSEYEGELVGFMIKLEVDPVHTAMSSFGTGFNPSSDIPPRVLLRLAQARADIDSELGGSLNYTNAQGLQIEVVAPSGAVSETTRLALDSEEAAPLMLKNRRPIADVASATGSLTQINSEFTLEAYQSGRPRSGSILQEPVTVTLHYTDNDVATINENTLILSYWNGGDWEYAACGLYERHPDENWLSVPVCHFGSQFTLFGLPLESNEPIVGLNAVNDSPTEIGQSTILTASITSGTNVSYSWDFGDGQTGSGAIVNHIYPAVGEYTAVVTATNAINELVTSTVINVIDEPIIGLDAVNDSPTEIGQSTILTASITSGTNVSYSWDFGDGETGNGAIVNHTYSAVGEYTAVVTASNTINELVTTTVVTITDEVIIGLNATNNGPTEIGQSTVLTASITSGTNVSYSWDFGDGQSGSGAIVNHTYLAVGEYTAVVTVTNAINELVTSTIVTVINDKETDEPIVGLDAVNDSPTEIGQSTILTASITSGTNVSYSWDFGDGETGNGAIVNHTYSAVGEYTAVVTASNTINELVTTTVVTITDEVIIGLNATNNGPTEIGQSTVLTASITSGTNVSYSWDFGDGQSGSGAIVNHTYLAVGEYTAVVTATNSINTVRIAIPVSVTVGSSDLTTYIYLPIVLMKSR